MTQRDTDHLVEVASYQNAFEAQIDVAALRSAGIQVEERTTGAYEPGVGYRTGVFVFADELDEARGLLSIGGNSPADANAEATSTYRQSQSYALVRTGLRILVAIVLALVIFSLIERLV